MNYRDINNQELHPNLVARIDQLLAGIEEQQRKNDELERALLDAIEKANEAQKTLKAALTLALRFIVAARSVPLPARIEKLAREAEQAARRYLN